MIDKITYLGRIEAYHQESDLFECKWCNTTFFHPAMQKGLREKVKCMSCDLDDSITLKRRIGALILAIILII